MDGSIGSVLTLGFGEPGSLGLVLTLGFGVGEEAAVAFVPPKFTISRRFVQTANIERKHVSTANIERINVGITEQ